jgi:DNA processing protein
VSCQTLDEVTAGQSEEWRWWLALWRAPGVGPKAFARFLEHFHTPQQVFAAPRAQLQALGIKTELIDYLQNPDWSAVAYDLDWLQDPVRYLLTLPDPLYPARLKAIHDPPPLLFVQGDPRILAYAQLAVVGARNPTRGGEENALEFARHLAGLGIVITSGMATGIDAAAHRGALEAGGQTVAVLGTGPDIVYPAKHKALAEAISANGALVSEFMPGMPPRSGNFPRRNRIISGLSLGTLVVEASLRSGSLITARLAAEQGREVFAIPGSIHSPMAKGCHALLKEGAKLVETAEDIVEELRLYPVPVKDPPAALPGSSAEPGLDEDYRRLLEYMGLEEPVSVDLLVERCGFNADMVSSMLLILELRGLVTSQSGGRYTRLALRKPS